MADYWFYIALCGCILEAAFICFEYTQRPVWAVVFKGAASLAFVTLGVALLSVTSDMRFGDLVVIGLAFGAAGDILLNLRKLTGNVGEKVFMAGIAAFFIGHLLYIAALISRGANTLFAAVPLCAVISVLLIPFMLKRIEVSGKLRIFGIVYVVLVFLMAGCAAGLLALQLYNLGHLLFTVGAVLFALSDVILIFNMFGVKKHKTFRAFNLSTYFLGQILIALSLLCI